MEKRKLAIICFFALLSIFGYILLALTAGPPDRVTIWAKVHDKYGMPIQGVVVEVYNLSSETGGATNTLIATAYTGDDGVAKLEDIPLSGLMEINATKDNYGTALKNISESDKASGLIDVYVPEKISLTINVYESSSQYTDKKIPISGVLVNVYQSSTLIWSGYTKEHGQVIVTGDPGIYYLKMQFSKEGYETQEEDVTMYRSDTWDVYLTPVSTPKTNISGPPPMNVTNRFQELIVTIKDANGPVSNARLDLYNNTELPRSSPVRTLYTDSRGVADFGVVTYENGFVDASKDGYYHSSVSFSYYTLYINGNVTITLIPRSR